MGMDCPFVATGDSSEEVMQKLSEHGAENHKEALEKMGMSDDEMREMMASKIEEM